MSHPVDVSVGNRVRLRRRLLGMSQQELARHIGIQFQQVQKYEVGANRISASRLWEIADALDVPVSFFFEAAKREKDPKRPASIPEDIFANKEAVNLVRAYYGIPETHRKKLFELAKVLAA